MAERMDIVWSHGFVIGRESIAVGEAILRAAKSGDALATEHNSGSVCKECGGSGLILLLTSTVPCDCGIK